MNGLSNPGMPQQPGRELAAMEGQAEVPGGLLRYRVMDAAGPSAPWAVFENGWGGSFPYWVFLERALALRLRTLCFDRAGTGESRATAPQTVPQLTAQFLALLGQLGIAQPVIVVGHSYGGLVAALHAVQAPEAIRAIVQIDPTPESRDPAIESRLRIVPHLGRLARLCAALGIPDPFFAPAGRDLPPQVRERILRSTVRSAASMRAALDELALLPLIRHTLQRTAGPECRPRLVISAGRVRLGRSWLQRRLVPAKQALDSMRQAQAGHRHEAATHPAWRWEVLPHDHSSLVTTSAGAADVARSVLRFLEQELHLAR